MNDNAIIDKHMGLNSLLVFIVLTAIGLSVFLPSMSIKYYDDDFQFVFPEPSSATFYYFFHNNSANNFYRPLQAMFMATVQRIFDLSTTPIHLATLTLHIILSWLVFLAMRYLLFSQVQSLTGALFILISQANVHAVCSNDTLSQVGSTFAGFLSILLLFKAVSHSKKGNDASERKHRKTKYALSLSLFTISELFKESGVSFLLIAAVVVFLSNCIVRASAEEVKSSPWQQISNRLQGLSGCSIRRGIKLLSPFIVITAIYLVFRSHVVLARATLGENPYDFHLGLNIIKNIALLSGAAVSPISTVSFYIAAKGKIFAVLAIYFLIALLFIIPIISGIFYHRRNALVQLSVLCAALSLFPAFLLNHVSELYTYNAMPFIAILVGTGFGSFIERSKRKVGRVLAIAAVIIIGSTNIGAVSSKIALMVENGERAHAIMKQVEYKITSSQGCGCFYLVNPPCKSSGYSIFLYNGFDILKHSLHYIKATAARENIAIKVIDRYEYDSLDKSIKEPCIFLTIDSCRGTAVRTLKN